MTANLYAPPKAALDDVTGGETAPPLWNPNAAASWSLVFSPAFGAYLHMKNWEALGESQKAAGAKAWLIATLAASVGLPLVVLFLPMSNPLGGVSNIISLVLLISWYYRAGKPQVAYVTARFGKNYPRRGWARPLLVASVALIVFVVALASATLSLLKI